MMLFECVASFSNHCKSVTLILMLFECVASFSNHCKSVTLRLMLFECVASFSIFVVGHIDTDAV